MARIYFLPAATTSAATSSDMAGVLAAEDGVVATGLGVGAGVVATGFACGVGLATVLASNFLAAVEANRQLRQSLLLEEAITVGVWLLPLFSTTALRFTCWVT